jgi:hypothetical protein
VLLKVVDHLEINLDELIGIEGELADEGVEVLHEIAEDGDLGLFLDEGDGVDDQPLLDGRTGDALIHEGKAELVFCLLFDAVEDGFCCGEHDGKDVLNVSLLEIGGIISEYRVKLLFYY